MGDFAFEDSLLNLRVQLSEAATVNARWDIIVHLMGSHGADVINYAVLNTLDYAREIAPVTQFSNMDHGWIDFYLSKRLDLADPHVRFVRERKHLPYRWSLQMVHHLESPAEKSVIEQAGEAGLRSQISVLAPDPMGAPDPIGGMTIGSSLDGAEFDKAVLGRETFLMSAGLLFHHYCIGEIRREQIGAKRLSIRERDCLTYVASGLRNARIAERMRITEATVELHLRNARRKLKAATTPQAIARAIAFGDIRFG